MRSGGVAVPPEAASRLGLVATFKPAYLIHGDDHGRIAERRARLRGLAEAESGTGGVELFEGDAATPEAVARALRAKTFAIGRRFLIVDGAERWKEGDVEGRRRGRAVGGRGRREPAGAHAGGDRTRHHGRLLRTRGGPCEGAGQARRGG